MQVYYLLIAFYIKHFMADYPLQNRYMLGKTNKDNGYILPLISHCLVHGVFTLSICLYVNPTYWWLSLVDMSVHFVVDRIKASPNLLGRFKSLCQHNGANATQKELRNNNFFWYVLGMDQMLHHLTDLFIIFMLLK